MSVEHRKEKHQFVLKLENPSAEGLIEYNDLGNNTIDMYHTFTPPEHRGKGVASKLATAAFDYALTNNIKVVPSCSYLSDTFYPQNKEKYKNIVVQSKM